MTLTERDVDFESTHMHVWEGGAGYPILLLHGSGAGASIIGNFYRVLDRLAERYRVLAADLVGFGLSGRKPAQPYFDIDMWVRQADRLIARMPDGPVGVVGHSLSGAIALKLAAARPRIARLLITGTMGAAFDTGDAAPTAGWTWPTDRAGLRKFVETLVYDPSVVAERDLDHRWRILSQEGYRDYFESMFRESRQYYVDAAVVGADELARIEAGVTMLHGLHDRSFPPQLTALALARSLPRSDVTVLGRCAHSVAVDRPEAFLAACEAAFG